MTEDLQNDIEFYRKTVKTNGMAIALVFYDVSDGEKLWML